jgi:hypothetical protein
LNKRKFVAEHRTATRGLQAILITEKYHKSEKKSRGKEKIGASPLTRIEIHTIHREKLSHCEKNSPRKR